MTHMSNFAWIEKQIQDAFPNVPFDVTDQRGDDQHLRLVIHAQPFKGLSLVKAHQKIYGVLDHMRHGRIHALSITLSEDEKEIGTSFSKV